MEIFKEKDYVVCIGSKDRSEVRGRSIQSYGWQKDFCYRIKYFTDDGGFLIAWFEEIGGGVYTEHLRLATEEEIKQYKKNKGPYKVLHPNSVNLVSLLSNLDKKIKEMENRENGKS